MSNTSSQHLASGQTSEEQRLSELTKDATHQKVREIDLWQYTPNDLLKFWADHVEEIEPELFDWFETFEANSTYFDMGASSGVFAVYAALKAQVKVYAFEPDAQNYCTADINIFLNSQDNPKMDINLFNMAVSDTLKTDKMYIRRYRAGDHNKILGVAELRDTAQKFTPEHTQAILCFPLDEMIKTLKFPIPKYLKIDVDGSETFVLKGGEKTLSSGVVQEVFIEIYDPEDGGEGKEIIATLNDFGFVEHIRYPVKHMRGGVYPDLYNIIFKYKGS